VTTVHVVVPDTIHDPELPSGGNTYNRRICAGLTAVGWSVRVHAVPGPWPRPDAQARVRLGRVLATLPEGAVALLDGLIASCTPEVVVPQAGRLRLVALVHMPLGDHLDIGSRGAAGIAEQEVLSAAAAVVTTSDWTRRWLLDRYALDPTHLHVAQPGVDTAALAPGTPEGGELLCVAAVTPDKGHDQLLTALAAVADLSWRCVIAGALTLDPGYSQRLVRQARKSRIGERVGFVGPLARDDLDRAYAASDLLVLASRAETYGLVVTEALARGLPVVAMAVGGLPEALGHGPDGHRPGLLVPHGDTVALAGALRSWLSERDLRERLRSSARGRRLTLSTWSETSCRIAEVLAEVAA
jgi:glycosyltransferase involved in cell wall biosynthesis